MIRTIISNHKPFRHSSATYTKYIGHPESSFAKPNIFQQEFVYCNRSLHLPRCPLRRLHHLIYLALSKWALHRCLTFRVKSHPFVNCHLRIPTISTSISEIICPLYSHPDQLSSPTILKRLQLLPNTISLASIPTAGANSEENLLVLRRTSLRFSRSLFDDIRGGRQTEEGATGSI